MSKWLIIGGGGFVASHFIDLLLENKEEVYATIRWNENLNNINHCKDKINLIEADLTDYISIFKAIESSKPDYISILGAESWVTSSFIRPQSTLMANGMGTLNILESIKYFKEKEGYNPIIHIVSSSEVYGLVKQEDVPIKETQPFNPANLYAVSKVCVDMLGQMYFNNYGLKIIRTRMFTHTGPRRVMMSAENFYAKYIAEIEANKREPFIPLGNMESIRTWADVRDAVRAYYLLVRKCKPGEVYNIGGNTTKTIQEVFNYLYNISKLKDRNDVIWKTDPKLLRPYDVTLQIPDCSKFKKDCSEWKPIYSFEQTMKDILNFWRAKIGLER